MVPSHSGRPATVVLSPSLGLDGANGHTLWKGRPGRAIEAGSSANRPRVLTGRRRRDDLPLGPADHARGRFRAGPGDARAARPGSRRPALGCARSPGLARLSPMQTRLCNGLGGDFDQRMYSPGDSLVGHPQTILERAAAAGPPGRGRHSSDRLFGPELVNSRSTPNVRTSLVGRNPGCHPAYDGRCADRGLRDRVRFIPGPPPVVEAGAGPPGRGRHSCCGVFGPAFLDPRSTSIGRTSVVGNPSCGGLAVDERIADRGLRGRARFIRGPPAMAQDWGFSSQAHCSRPF